MNFTTTPPTLESSDETAMTQAALEAADHRAANLNSLALTQAALAEQLPGWNTDLEWVYARDGALTVLRDGHWWTDCSVPRRAGQAMLKSLEAKGTVACYLYPAHPAHVKTVLQQTPHDHALVVIWPDLDFARIAMGCCDFADEISRGRLWFAVGQDWPRQLAEIFDQQPGLSTPQIFVRTSTLNEEYAAEMVPAAQHVFSQLGEKRAAAAQWAAQSWVKRHPVEKVCVLARSQFRLWENDALDLANLLRETSTNTVITIDLDDPRQASTLHLAQTAGQCDALLMVNAGRADISVPFADALPVITWITIPRIPACLAARDALLLLHASWRDLAIQAGWSQDRIMIVGRPPQPTHTRPKDLAPSIAIIADTAPLNPKADFEYSSHQLLWEMIGEELSRDPFALGHDVNDYLSNRMQRMGISEEGVDRPRFIDALIVPAWQQGLARAALNAGLHLRLHGKGWDNIPDLAASSSGEITNQHELDQAIAASSALIHVWPVAVPHQIESLGRPVSNPLGRKRGGFIEDLRRLVTAPTSSKPADPRSSVLTWDIIQHLTK